MPVRYIYLFNMMKRRILVAMSGGVDSATTAALLREQGHEVIGVTMQLWDYGESEGGCCSADEVCDARKVAHDLGIPHYVVNYMDAFKELVVSDFIEKYENGRTPIPCILCNQFMKFDFLLKRALELGADYLATGHYARIVENNGKLCLAKGVDVNKDQSYFLFTLKENHLRKLIFPLGDKTKAEVREIAHDLGVKVAKKPESMGVCFITGGSYKDFLKPYLKKGKESGEIVDTDGNYLADHSGISGYTVGQRRGLGVAAGKPLYVVNVDARNNRIVLGEEDKLYNRGLEAEKLSWVNPPEQDDMRVNAKIRYRHGEEPALVRIDKESEVARVEFDTPQRAITPGQAVVFYQEDMLIGGGWISEVA